MSKGSLSDAVRAAGYAMATSEELLDLSRQATESRKTKGHQAVTVDTQVASETRTTKADQPSPFKAFFSSWVAWA
ncbi:MAG: hypothetical protein R3D57_01040 [Hyphomicrobiaceae bacterium]